MKNTVYFKVYQNNNRKIDKAYGKYFGRVVHFDEVDADGLAKHIMEHGSVYTDDVVVGLVRKFTHCIQELLTQGKKVKLDGIGTLYLSASTSGVEKPEDWDPQQHIKAVRVRLLPDQSDDSLYSVKGLRRAASFRRLPKNLATDDEGGDDDNGFVEDQP